MNYLSAAAAAQRSWRKQVSLSGAGMRNVASLLRRGKRYASGFLRGAAVRGSLIPVPMKTTAAAVVYAPGSATLLRSVLKRLRELPLREIVVVLHDAAPHLFAAARSVPGTTIVYSPELEDADIGRALGARLTTADVVLFADGGHSVKPGLLAGFLWACGSGMDVVLNDMTPLLGSFRQRQDLYRLAEFLNRTMKRRDLRANSLSSLPYALSRKALNQIGPAVLAIPPKAHTAAIFGSLRIGTGGSIKPKPPPSVLETDRWKKAAENHVEAWREALNIGGKRMFFPDNLRNRSLLGEST